MEFELSDEQIIAFNKYIQGENVFITGPGGSGKTELIKKIYNDAILKSKEIQVCALTGCAAILLNCKAKTIHSWGGIGIANGSIDSIVVKVLESKFKKLNWKLIQILIIDEVSMMSKKIFTILDKIAKKVRKQPFLPFGGIQIIFSGDFYQLPPVGSKDEIETQQFCFESEDWNNTFPIENQIQLIKIFRQKDPIYSKILNQIREGKIKRSSNEILLQHVGKNIKNMEITPTKLFPTKFKVEQINNSEMEAILSEEIIYKIKEHYELPLLTKQEKEKRKLFDNKDIEIELNYMKSNLNCDTELKLKVGAQVMCIVNMELPSGETLCNGTRGIIVRINDKNIPIVKFNNIKETIMGYYIWESENIPGIGISQIPLILAWALTIHKSQGSTLEVAEIDVGSGIFECGQSYVALSRVKSLEGLFLTSFDPTKIRVHKKVQDFYEKLNNFQKKEKENIELLPVADAIFSSFAYAIPL